MYARILLALDGSDLARAALPHATELARTTGAEMVLLQVIDSVGRMVAQTTPAGFEPMSSGRITAEVAETAVSGQRQAAERHLREVQAEIEAAGVGSVRTQIIEGTPGEAIVHTAQDLECDLVVMATHGRSGLGRAVLGSVAEHVVRHSERSAVLLVRAAKDG